MKTKEGDVYYCGVNEEKIKSAKPILNEKNISLFFHWIKERYTVHIKKDIKHFDPPWTEDKIIQKYRFTNVRREQDRETKWLIKNISENNSLSMEEKILNTLLFRTWNKSSTVETYGGPWRKKELEVGPINFRRIVTTQHLDLPFTSAFSTSFLKEIWRFSDGKGSVKYKLQERNLPNGVEAIHDSVPLRMFYIVPWVLSHNILSEILNSTDQKECINSIKKIPGFGEFLSYQVFVDLSYIPNFKYSENEVVVAGPGAKRGIDFLFENKDDLTYEECIFWLRDNQNYYLLKYNINLKILMEDLLLEDRYLNVMSIENCLCEIDKYLKAYYKKSLPKRKYTV